MDSLTITRPDDWHLHLRDAETLQAVLPHTARQFARAIVMPNLKPPVRKLEEALAYRERILAAVPAGLNFEPLMTLYLTDNTTSEDIREAKASGLVHGVKYYPAGATTNSDFGVTKIDRVKAVLETMAEVAMPLLVHGEVTHAEVDIFDREARFIEEVLEPLHRDCPNLRIVMEHITTQQAAEYVKNASENIAATITAHHLLLNRNAIFVGGIRPHHYCLPILKREQHRQALLDVATSGNKKFFLGTDSAPHAKGAKEAACGCAGIYTALSAIELYAEAFEERGALAHLQAFASENGPDFYHLPRNQDTITLRKETLEIPATLDIGGGSELIPMRAGETVSWRLVD